jgi:glyoxylase-like metal-dependent hydrolase (beta-lactamase superfamily II)
MSIEIVMLTLGIVQTNAYLVGDTETKNAILIDPVDDALTLLETAEKRGWTIKLILATHAHFDHVLASKALKDATNAPFVAHKDTQTWLEILPKQGFRFGMGEFPEAATPDRLLGNDDEIIELDSIRFTTLYTPGHAPGHVAFYEPNLKVVFSGDALFQGSIGRTDLPGGNYEVLMQSIFNKLIPLGDDVRVLSGHGAPTTIGIERQSNPFLRDYA